MSGSWLELRWAISRKKLDEVTDALFALDCLGTQEDHLPGQAPPPRQPWDTGAPPPPPEHILLRGWWPADHPTCRRAVEVLAARLGGEVSWGAVTDTGWADAWRTHFVRHVIGDRLSVAPPWEAQDGDLVIEPGMAFGSGEHPTTMACLQGVVQHARPGAACLDVGCGSGILALAAAKLGMSAVGIDIDRDAVAVARDNAVANGLQADFSDTPLSMVQGRYPLVVANVYAEVLAEMAPDLARLCSGVIVLAGILADRESLVTEALHRQGWSVTGRTQEGEWVSLELRAS